MGDDRSAAIARLIGDAVARLRDDLSTVGEDIHLFDMDVYLLCHLLDVGGAADHTLAQRHLVGQALRKMKSDGAQPTADVLRQTVGTLLSEQTSTPPKTFRLLCALNITPPSPVAISQAFPVGPAPSICSVTDVLAVVQPASDDTWPMPPDKEEFERYAARVTWLSIPCPHPVLVRAFDLASHRFQLFRALCNLVLTFRTITWQSGLSELAPVRSSWYWFLVDDDTHGVTVFTSPTDPKGFRHTIRDEQWKRVQELGAALQRTPESRLKRLLIQALLLYNEAHDTTSREYTYLVLWSILDTLVGDGGRLERRLKGLYKRHAVDRATLIDALYHKRNLVVHQGRLEVIDLEDVNYLRIVVQDALMFALRAAPTLRSTSELGEALLSIRGYPGSVESTRRVSALVDEIMSKRPKGE